MPVCAGHTHVKNGTVKEPVHNRNDSVTTWRSESTTGQEIILHVYDEQRLLAFSWHAQLLLTFKNSGTLVADALYDQGRGGRPRAEAVYVTTSTYCNIALVG